MRRIMYATALAACCIETDALLPFNGHSRTVQAVRACRTPSPACSADEGNNLQAEAERLALLAERASLEAEALEMEAETIRAAKLAAEPEPPPPPPAAIDDAGPMALSAPLRWIGPYPAVALSFPALASPAQKARLLTNPNQAANLGVTLDFVIDTAANTNTISAKVAGPTGAGGLELQQVGRIEGGVGAGGAIGGGATYMLGGCELADLPKAERGMVMSDLTAAARAEAEAPSLTFYADARGTGPLRARLSGHPLTRLPESALPRVTLVVNGVAIPALLDTGSPVTVLNPAAAAAAGLALPDFAQASQSKNPFERAAAALQAGQAAARGDVLTVAGAEGAVQLTRTSTAAALELAAAQDE